MLWHPIADAPRDGSEVICFVPDIGMRVLEYTPIVNDNQRWTGWKLAGVDGPADYEPTHFAFVQPPEPSGEQKDGTT